MFAAKIDRVKKTITISRSDLIAAGQFGTPEFEQMMRMRTEFPGYTIVEHHIKRNADRQTYGYLHTQQDTGTLQRDGDGAAYLDVTDADIRKRYSRFSPIDSIYYQNK